MRAIHLALLLLFGVRIALMLSVSAYLSIILGYSAPRASSTWLPFYFLPFVAISSSIPARPTHLWLIFPFVVALVVLCWPWAFVLWSVLPFQLALLCNHVSPSDVQLLCLERVQSLLVAFVFPPLGCAPSHHALLRVNRTARLLTLPCLAWRSLALRNAGLAAGRRDGPRVPS